MDHQTIHHQLQVRKLTSVSFYFPHIQHLFYFFLFSVGCTLSHRRVCLIRNSHCEIFSWLFRWRYWRLRKRLWGEILWSINNAHFLCSGILWTALNTANSNIVHFILYSFVGFFKPVSDSQGNWDFDPIVVFLLTNALLRMMSLHLNKLLNKQQFSYFVI